VQGVEEQELEDASLSKEGICLEFTKEFDEAKGKAIAKNVTRPSDLRSRMKERLAGGSGDAGQAQAPSSAAPVSEVRVRTFEGQMAEKHKDPGVASQARPKASSDGENDPQFGLVARLKREERFGCSQASSSTKVERAQELAEEKAKRAARFGTSKAVVDSSSGAKITPVNELRSLEELSAAKSKSLSRSSVPLQARSSASSGVEAHASSTEDPHCGLGAMLKRAERFGCSKVDGSGKMAQVTAAAPSGIGSSSGSGITMLSEPNKRSTSGRSSLDQRLADFVVARMQEQGSGSTEPLPQLASQLYKFDEQAKPHIRAKGGALRWCQGRPELRVFPNGHGGVAGCTVGLAPPSRRVKRSSTELAASDGTKRARVDSGKSLTDRTGSTGTTPLSKREGKRPMAAQPLTVNPDGLVAMELSVRGEKEISTRRREMIEQKSGCRQEHMVGAKRFSVRGDALQLRHAAELLLKGATGTKNGVPELHVAANDTQANWILGKDGGKLQELWKKHPSVKIVIGQLKESIRVISLRGCNGGGIMQIREAVHDIAELWLGQGTAPSRLALLSGGLAGGSSSSAAGPSSAASASARLSDVHVRSLEENGAEQRAAGASASAPPSSGKARAITPEQPSAQQPTSKPTPCLPVAASGGPAAKSPAAALTSASPAATSATDDEEEMVQPRAASLGTRSRTQSPERLDEQAEAETRAARLEQEQAEMREELLRLEEELRRERQRAAAKEQAPLSDEQRRQLVANLWEAVKDKREMNTGKGAKE